MASMNAASVEIRRRTERLNDSDVDGPRLVSKRQGGVIITSANLGNNQQAVASFLIPADATSTLFIALTPDGLRAQSTFLDTTTVR
jgi:hypothetical protein